jgi:predicted nucleic acid-binding protein
MKLIIDTNSIISALIKDSASRRIIMSTRFEFLTPDYTLKEIYKHKGIICRKAGIGSNSFEILLALIFERITTIPTSEYNNFFEEAKALVRDIKDIPFLACALSQKTGIWSDDKDFDQQSEIKIWKTRDLLKLL